jgi:hypothetical protein
MARNVKFLSIKDCLREVMGAFSPMSGKAIREKSAADSMICLQRRDGILQVRNGLVHVTVLRI